MEIVAITLARLTSMVHLHAWDPFGKTTTLEAIQTLASAFSFARYPRAFAELDISKGIEVAEGRMGEIVIDKITIYLNGIVIDTRSSTENCEVVFQAIVDLIQKALGASIKAARHSYTSQINFRSDMDLLAMQPPIIRNIAGLLSQRTSDDLKHPFTFQPTALLINADLSQAKIPPSVFSVERLAETPFAERLYVSTAPLRTSQHIQVLEQFEAAIPKL